MATAPDACSEALKLEEIDAFATSVDPSEFVPNPYACHSFSIYDSLDFDQESLYNCVRALGSTERASKRFICNALNYIRRGQLVDPHITNSHILFQEALCDNFAIVFMSEEGMAQKFTSTTDSGNARRFGEYIFKIVYYAILCYNKWLKQMGCIHQFSLSLYNISHVYRVKIEYVPGCVMRL